MRIIITGSLGNIGKPLTQEPEEILGDYFDNETLLKQRIPTVQYLSEHLNISPGYLSDMAVPDRSKCTAIHTQ